MCLTRSDAAQIDQCLTFARVIQKGTGQSALYITRFCLSHRLNARVTLAVISASVVSLNEVITAIHIISVTLTWFFVICLSIHEY